ncbi:cytochrome P450 [Ilumatobacter fluminis]|uniref:Cytochrome P450 n=1 Tax=Ilumatobacter fluminis TaxID=467091 RepID=A0A4R7I1N4_9ACTN|nr:cytochrome P450 [Ilumatobacter fluminis]TDT16779.1 cytochrome P450 [Ilumatobacter fluminis]
MGTLATELDLPDLSYLDDADRTWEESRDAADEVARQHWLARGLLGFAVLHYDDVVAVLRDKRWHSASGQILEMAGIEDSEWTARRRQSILSAEGDEHVRLRRLVGPAFSPRHADSLRPFMRQVVDDLIDGFVEQGRADIAVDFCEPYPIPIICELFGAPKEDWKQFSHWATDIFRIFNNNLEEDLPAIVTANIELDDYLGELIDRRRDTPTDDLVTTLIAAEDEGDRLSHDELISLCVAVLMAGTDTTRNQLGCSTYLFAKHPEQWALLRERPELAPRAVEETMRFLGAVRGTVRIASEDIEYRDVVFPKGTIMATSLSAANLDADTFDDPFVFDITREPSNKPQLTFGSGIHFCLGAALARAEQQEALTIMADRLPNLRLDGEVEWKPNSFGIWGPAALPVAFG